MDSFFGEFPVRAVLQLTAEEAGAFFMELKARLEVKPQDE